MIARTDPRAAALATALRRGDIAALERLLADDPTLATERFGSDRESRSALHLATDWPARFPDVDRAIELLVDAGADVDARFVGAHRETALHWAASADDVTAIDALLRAGADIEADGGVLTDGPPLDDAVVFAQWNAARSLVGHGATLEVWHAAALGVMEALRRLVTPEIDQDDLDNACWHACRAGQSDAVRLLVGRGADLDRVGHENRSAREAARASGAADLVAWVG